MWKNTKKYPDDAGNEDINRVLDEPISEEEIILDRYINIIRDIIAGLEPSDIASKYDVDISRVLRFVHVIKD